MEQVPRGWARYTLRKVANPGPFLDALTLAGYERGASLTKSVRSDCNFKINQSDHQKMIVCIALLPIVRSSTSLNRVSAMKNNDFVNFVKNVAADHRKMATALWNGQGSGQFEWVSSMIWVVSYWSVPRRGFSHLTWLSTLSVTNYWY